MAAVPGTSAYGTRASQLAPPVGAEPQPEAQAEPQTPQMRTPQGAPAGGKPPFNPNAPSEDIFGQEAGAEKPPFDPNAPSEDISAEGVPDALSPNLASKEASVQDIAAGNFTPPEQSDVTGEGGTEPLTALKSSFATTDKEKKAVLEGEFGSGSVRKTKDGEWQVKRPGSEKFSKFDEGWINWLIEKTARPGTEIVASVPATAAGALTGGPVGLIAGRAAGGAMGSAAADLIAGGLGVPQDETRNKGLEYGVSGTLNALLPPAAEKVLGLAAKGLGVVKATPVWEAASSYSRQLVEGAEELAKAGKAQFLENGKVALLPHQVAPNSAEAVRIARESADSPQVQKLLNQQAENWSRGAQDYLRAAADTVGVKLEDTARLAGKATDLVNGIDKREGAIIGRYAKLADETAKGQIIKFPDKLSNAMATLQKDLGVIFNRDAGKLTAEMADPQVLVGKLGVATEAEIKYYQRGIENFLRKANDQGGMSVKGYEEAITLLQPIYERAAKRGGEIKAVLGSTMSELRAARREAVGQFLKGADKEAYTESMNKFSALKSAREDLGKALQEDITNKAFTDKIINGRDIGGLKAAKALFERESPEVWQQLKANYVEGLIANAADRTSRTGLNSTQVLKKLLDPGLREANKTVFEKGEIGDLARMFQVVERIEQTDFSTAAGRSAAQKAGEALVTSLGHSWYMRAKGALAVMGLMRKNEDKFMELMTKDGFNKFMGRVPKGQQTRVREILSALQESYNEKRLSGTYGAVRAGAQAPGYAGKVMTEEALRPQGGAEE